MFNLHVLDELVHIFYRNVHKFVPFLDCPRVSQNDTSAALRVLNTAFYDTSSLSSVRLGMASLIMSASALVPQWV